MTVGGKADGDLTILDTFSGNDDFLKRMIPRRPQRHSTAPNDNKDSKTIDTADEGMWMRPNRGAIQPRNCTCPKQVNCIVIIDN
jgi:hypothetical protein